MSVAADFNSFLSAIATLPAAKQSAAAGILCSAVGDAAARPFHWVYDKEQLREIISEKVNVNFLNFFCKTIDLYHRVFSFCSIIIRN